MVAKSYTSLPIVDWNDLTHNRAKFLSDLRQALADVGFLVITNAPGFDDDFQQRMFKEARAFFDAPGDVKLTADIRKSPHFRGYSKPAPGDSGNGVVMESFTYGFECTPVAARDDATVPIYERAFRGPNTWPDARVLPRFRPAVEELRQKYHRLHHDLGRLACESLGESPDEFDKYFKFDDPDLSAMLNHYFGMDHIAPALRESVRQEYAKHKSSKTFTHIDGPPAFALLINDRPGLEVVAGEGKWIRGPVTCQTAPGAYPAPVIPGSVIANVGATLMHLSRGRLVATLHRVNTTLIPDGDTRISLPFFELPKMQGPLIPFGDAGHDTGYLDRDRGENAAVNRMNAFPQVTKRFWQKEYDLLSATWQKEMGAETSASFKLAADRGARNTDSGEDASARNARNDNQHGQPVAKL